MTRKPMPSGGGSFVRQVDGQLLTHDEAAQLAADEKAKKAAQKAAEKALKQPVKED